MLSTCIENANMVRPGQGVAISSVLLTDGKISAINPSPQDIPALCEHFDAEGALLTPGLIDIHTHGVHEFLYERDPQDLIAGTATLPRYGTTCVLPTLYRVLNRRSLATLEKLADALEETAGPAIPGFHLEGPFLALPGAGAATEPGDVVLLGELLSALKGRVCAVSVSPDCPNVLPVIERLSDKRIAVFLTHTRATVDQTQAALDAGARHATHFYDLFSLPPETDAGVRPVGAVETILADERCTVDFICDGVHVHPMAIRAALRAKGWQGVVAITDSNIGAGLPSGVYESSWGYSVRVQEGHAARVATENHPLIGQLAGSSLTMNVAMQNVIRWLQIPPAESWAMATLNPASVVGLPDKGRIEVGCNADLVQWDTTNGTLRAARTWVGGNCVYTDCCENAGKAVST